jgi:hypothetical protein
MGSLNPFSKPKMPAPVVTPAPTVDNTESQTELSTERKRRAGATGSSANIVSSLAGAVSDIQATTKKSTLLGG